MKLTDEDVLRALHECSGELERWCASFRRIAAHIPNVEPVLTPETYADIRRRVRRLARKGYAEFHKGLWTEDGEPAGAGYCITEQGRAALAEKEE